MTLLFPPSVLSLPPEAAFEMGAAALGGLPGLGGICADREASDNEMGLRPWVCSTLMGPRWKTRFL